jgi:hypothetical protein
MSPLSEGRTADQARVQLRSRSKPESSFTRVYLRATLATHGDGILGVFALAEDALTAALVALRALQVMDWSAVDGLRVVGSDRLDPLRTGTDDSFHHLANHPSTERTPLYYARAVSQPASLAR